MVVTTVVEAAILLASAPREGVTGEKEGEDEDVGEEDEGEEDDQEEEDEVEEDEGGGVVAMKMNTGSRDMGFGNELFTE